MPKMGTARKKRLGKCISVDGKLLNILEIISSFCDISFCSNFSPMYAFEEAGEKIEIAKAVAEISLRCAKRTRGFVNFAIGSVSFRASRKEATKSPNVKPMNNLKRGVSGGR